MRNCGGCQSFLKIKNSRFRFSAICLSSDYNTGSDRGHDCKFWKAIPYERKDAKAVIRKIRRTELVAQPEDTIYEVGKE
jgi:hypothetical protein